MIANPTPGSAFAVGLLLFAPGITFIAAVQVIATANADVEATTVAIIVVVVINAILVWLPLLVHIFAPGATTRYLTAFNGWLRANGNKILIAVLFVGGAHRGRQRHLRPGGRLTKPRPDHPSRVKRRPRARGTVDPGDGRSEPPTQRSKTKGA